MFSTFGQILLIIVSQNFLNAVFSSPSSEFVTCIEIVFSVECAYAYAVGKVIKLLPTELFHSHCYDNSLFFLPNFSYIA